MLPGVGHFGQMMRALDDCVRDTLRERIAAGVPFLGICLGMQALFETSEEAPEVEGLGIFPGIVERFPADARVPHMGWNKLEVRPGSRLMPEGEPYVYFAHSYYVPEVRAGRRRSARTRSATRPRSKRATSSACSSTRRSRAPSALNIVRRFRGASC